MRTARVAPFLAAVLLAASRAAAHGPSTGALQPHAHPHVEEGFGGWGVALLAAAAVGAVGLIARAVARRR